MVSFRIRLEPSGQEFMAEPNETVLAAALRQGHALPYSCRNGSCATCKSHLISGSVDYGSYDESALSAQERAVGKVLLCQAVPKSDLVVEAKELAAASHIPIRMLPARVVQLERAADDVMIVRLKLAAGTRLEFLAGQYLDILLKDNKRRSFSLANAPQDDEFLELHIRHVPDGLFSTQVFTSMKERDLLRFQGPLGTFFLRADDAKGDATLGIVERGQRKAQSPRMPGAAESRPIILVAGGTGFAPIKSIIEDAIGRGEARPMHLYWGARARRDLYRHALAESWRASYSSFRYTPVLSAPAADDQWTGRTGWVHEAVVADHPDLSGFEVYASGPPAMIHALQKVVKRHGLAEDRLYYDSFEHARNR